MPIDKPSILIVEDIDEDLDILSTILKDDFQLHIAKTAEDSLKIAMEQRPDLILLDIVLPDKTGFAVLEELKASCETADIPVIVITSAEGVQNEERGLTLGAVDYIVKPFHHTLVMLRIRTHLKILQDLRTAERIGWTDAATGVPNRRRFEKQLATEWGRAGREQKPLGLLLISVDRFKEYCDAHGSRTGDVLLQKAVEVMCRILKHSEDAIFRYDTNRFVVLLPDVDKTALVAVSESVRTGIEATQVRVHDSLLAPISVSIGMAAAVPQPTDRSDDLLIEAERLLLQAQATGHAPVQRRADERKPEK